jgi:16S rRNA (cytosine1402-N4)-methyltransferase
VGAKGASKKLEGERKFDGGLFIDATLGTAGHTIEFLKAHPRNRVFAFDRDGESMRFAWQRLQEENLAHRVALVQSDFRLAGQALDELQKVVAENFVDGKVADAKVGSPVTGNSLRESLLENFENWEVVESENNESFAPRVLFVGQEFASRPADKIAGALIDAGMSLHQVLQAERGLSFRADAPLDMRYDRTRGVSAFDLVNELSQDELEDLFFKFTDERWARRIAEFITAHRRSQVIHTTSELAAIIEAAIPAGVRRHMRVHPATRAFAALRLAVNDEFWALEEGVWALSAVLANAARLAVLTYSSHEDRTVKRTFRRLAGRPLEMENRFQKRREKRSALSNPQSDSSMRPPLTPFQTLENFSLRLPTEADQNAVPDWIAGFESEWKMKIITGKPIEPSEEEVEANPLSRSCKLRVLEKVEL